MFRERPEEVPEKRPDVFSTYPYGLIGNSKGGTRSGTSLGRTQDVHCSHNP